MHFKVKHFSKIFGDFAFLFIFQRVIADFWCYAPIYAKMFSKIYGLRYAILVSERRFMANKKNIDESVFINRPVSITIG